VAHRQLLLFSKPIILLETRFQRVSNDPMLILLETSQKVSNVSLSAPLSKPRKTSWQGAVAVLG